MFFKDTICTNIDQSVENINLIENLELNLLLFCKTAFPTHLNA